MREDMRVKRNKIIQEKRKIDLFLKELVMRNGTHEVENEHHKYKRMFVSCQKWDLIGKIII